jgi:signal transduction histidine kinase
MKYSILCIDDEIDNLDALERLFRKKYLVLKAASGDEGLRLLREHPGVAVIISDQRMPQMTGVEFLERSQKIQPEAVRILLTGFTDVGSVISAINEGRIYRYVTKPWDSVDFVNAVDKAVQLFEMSHQLREKNIALEKALAELKTLDEAKTQFMILINHELKTPLTVVLSYLELLQETKLSAEQIKFAGRIQEGAMRLQKLVSDALELIAATTGTLKIQIKKIQLDKALAGLAEEVSDGLLSKKQELDIEIDPAGVKADPKIIRSVVLRLIDNAIKFSEKGAKLQLTAMVMENGIRLTVANPGKPLSKHIINNVSQPFAVDEDIMHHSQGSGLGLSLCQALLKTHQTELFFGHENHRIQVGFELPSGG